MNVGHLVPWLYFVLVSCGPANRGRNDISLNTKKLNELGSQGQLLLRHIAITTHSCGIKDQPKFRRKLLRQSPVSCNDGSPAGYYIRKSHGSSKWLVFLEGGWYCFDKTSCRQRFRMMNEYMSSRKWPRHRKGSGIMSWDPEENPYYFHANMVIIPYCSSDSWSGTKNASSREEFSFMGSLILEEVIKELMRKGLRNAQKLLLLGSSAGGIGVLINLDRVAEVVHMRAPGVEVRGVVDAGWFLDNEPYKPQTCTNAFSCSPTLGINKGIDYWSPRLPPDCVAQYPTEIWRCYFGHRIYPHLKTPLFILQNLYDAAQIKVDNVFDDNGRGAELSSGQWSYLLKLGEEVKQTLQNATAVFAPACVSHDVLTESEWYKIKIQGVTLAQSLYCWEESSGTSSGCHHQLFSTNRANSASSINRSDKPLSDEPPSSNRRRQKGKRKRRRNRKKNRGRRGKKNRDRRAAAKTSCRHHLLDECPWPHCNCSCPKCRWDTMNEVNKYFMRSIASVMGIDPRKLENVHLCGY
ncbi:palmitoleoyl-protein carboxylesterase NOTUM-like [Gigantopelta aegis]|uniref:palmitoleoyl-protein carboxylesterase NOTUM-like n=1 Tax=Gigantopelta aegis TaxID=1735272 RepID=UPI001B888460|nr:palmitoleoyl-protein carboxylesterase NOTUM-like [Gigantopelta aegis]